MIFVTKTTVLNTSSSKLTFQPSTGNFTVSGQVSGGCIDLDLAVCRDGVGGCWVESAGDLNKR